MRNKKGGDATGAVVRNLHEAIARVREDVEKVEFWAEAVSGFSEPVPPYKSSDVNIWLPGEQAKKLQSQQSAQNESSAKRDEDDAHGGEPKP